MGPDPPLRAECRRMGSGVEIMANAKKENWVRVELHLTEEEARYIKAMTQNPIVEGGMESARSRKIRESVFLALAEFV